MNAIVFTTESRRPNSVVQHEAAVNAMHAAALRAKGPIIIKTPDVEDDLGLEPEDTLPDDEDRGALIEWPAQASQALNAALDAEEDRQWAEVFFAL